MNTKKCSKCGEDRAVELFRKHRNRCNICEKEYNMEYHKKNKEKIAEKSKKYRQEKENNEKQKKRIAKWRQENKDKVVEYSAMYWKLWVEKCTDPYIRGNLRLTLGITNPPQELVELKRVQLMIHRQLKNGAQP